MPKRSFSNDEDEASMINITVVDQVEHNTYFKVSRHTKMEKVFRAYCKRRNKNHTIEFLYEGNRISHQGHKTPAQLGIGDGDEISAMESMMGG